MQTARTLRSAAQRSREVVRRQRTPKLPTLPEIRRFQRSLLGWYRKHGREFPWRGRSVSIYRLVVTETLLQRTRAETVAVFYHHFFQRFPTWAKLANASEAELRAYLKPIGLWKRRAASLSRLARTMRTLRGRFSTLPASVEALPGVGQYVGNAISLFAHGKAAPLLDSGMARVLERHFGPRQLADIRYDPYLQKLAHLVVADPASRELNWGLLDLASLVCRKHAPACAQCPVQTTCRYRQAGRRSVERNLCDKLGRERRRQRGTNCG